ncbi:hypothetical protein DSO57_1018366 [Entomophthora muscae]|uniref:Uncharacterized protein n=1 Tax=Entomophthora muscae TaxID=34485 RepID=A0ACC2T4M1_9FUNG|nr:hypothetical protein DSO57_1018366 [Entomophthora muscae]
MLPKIVLEEIFSLLDRKQLYRLRLLCLAFYQAAFPLLLRIHSLKQVKYIDYQRFLKKNGKHVEGLIIKQFDDYQALLSSGLSLSTISPQLRLLERLAYNSNSPEGLSMVEDCLQLKNLKHMGFSIVINPVSKGSSLFFQRSTQSLLTICSGLVRITGNSVEASIS